MFHVPERCRLPDGLMGSDCRIGNNGAFVIDEGPNHRRLTIIASDGLFWEHVSVKAHQGNKTRIPTWQEMCFIKSIFWDGEDVVMQLHPRESQYVNTHPSVLHLWRPGDMSCGKIPEPPSELVGLVSRFGAYAEE